jgi:hypothetical protein
VNIRLLRASLPVPAMTYTVDSPAELTVITDRRLSDLAVDTAVVAALEALREAGKRD